MILLSRILPKPYKVIFWPKYLWEGDRIVHGSTLCGVGEVTARRYQVWYMGRDFTQADIASKPAAYSKLAEQRRAMCR